jgi:hypothetical protein
MERRGLEAQDHACLAWSSVLPREQFILYPYYIIRIYIPVYFRPYTPLGQPCDMRDSLEDCKHTTQTLKIHGSADQR